MTNAAIMSITAENTTVQSILIHNFIAFIAFLLLIVISYNARC